MALRLYRQICANGLLPRKSSNNQNRDSNVVIFTVYLLSARHCDEYFI